MALRDFLAGCVWEYPSRYPGLARVLSATEDQVQSIKQLPGHLAIEGSSSPELNGLYVAVNILDMGDRPGHWKSYPEEPVSKAPSGLQLEEHQLRSVSYLRSVDERWRGAILGADAGLGKCVMSLQSLWLDGFLHKPGLIIAPLQARSAWVGETSDAWKHYQLPIFPVTGTTPDRQTLTSHLWYFIHFEIVHKWEDAIFSTLKPASLIVDESHNLSNLSARRTTQVFELAKMASIKRRILLTGTPIPKTRMDLWPQLGIAQPGMWDESKHRYGVRYAAGHKEAVVEGGDAYWHYDGQSNTTELRARLCGVYLRYTKNDVPGCLPKLKRKAVEVRGELNLEKYWDAQVNLPKYLKRKDTVDKIQAGGLTINVDKKPKATQLVSMTTLITLLEEAKQSLAVKEIVKLAAEFDKIVVFAWQRKVAKYITTELKKYATVDWPKEWIIGPITGAQQQPERERMGRSFAALDKGICVCTRGAMGCSLNELASAQAVLQTSPAWNPADNLQAESRVHRKGNPHQFVVALYLIASGTMDDVFMESLHAKAEEAAALADTDTDGLNLVGDLTPQGLGEAGTNLDAVCALLAEMDED